MVVAQKQVETVEAFHAMPAEFQEAVRKIVISHAVNELYGAQVFDEPAIALAPNPYAKWLTCRVAMEAGPNRDLWFTSEATALAHSAPDRSLSAPRSVMSSCSATMTQRRVPGARLLRRPSSGPTCRPNTSARG